MSFLAVLECINKLVNGFLWFVSKGLPSAVLRARRCGGLVCFDKVFCAAESKASSQRLVVATVC